MKTLTLSTVPAAVTISGALGQSAWLPPASRISVTGMFLYQNSHRISAGAKLMPLRDRPQRTFAIGAEYGLTDSVALDISTGYGYNTLGPSGLQGKDSGLIDTNMGLRWRLVDERRHTYLPTFSIRAGGAPPRATIGQTSDSRWAMAPSSSVYAFCCR